MTTHAADRRAEVRRGGSASRPCPSRSRPIDLVHLARQTLGDRELEREILGLMARQLDRLAPRIDLASDVERSRLAHSVKGAARSIGAFQLADAAAGVEAHPEDRAARDAFAVQMERAADFIKVLLG